MSKLIFNLDWFDKNLKEAIKNKEDIYLVLMECPLINSHQWNKKYHKYFKRILTWNYDLVDNDKYFKFYWEQDIIKKDCYNIPFSDKKFICMANANKIAIGKGELYSERKKIALFLQKNEPDFDLYGPEWNKKQFKLIPFIHVLKNIFNSNIKQLLYYIDYVFNIRQFICYKGTVDDIIKTYSKYKFNICYENANCYNGYITEKIWNCFNARCVPIYWGAPDITKHIPANTFIDRRNFRDNEHMYEYIKSIKETEYNKYIKNINIFLNSERAELFSKKSFRKRVEEICNIQY